MRVLLVEDDARTASFIEKGLVQAGFIVEAVSDGKDGLHMALTNTSVSGTFVTLDSGLNTFSKGGDLNGNPVAKHRGITRFKFRISDLGFVSKFVFRISSL